MLLSSLFSLQLTSVLARTHKVTIKVLMDEMNLAHQMMVGKQWHVHERAQIRKEEIENLIVWQGRIICTYTQVPVKSKRSDRKVVAKAS